MGVKKIGNLVANKVLHIDTVGQPAKDAEELHKCAKETVGNAYIEEDPTVTEWLCSLMPTRNGFRQYVHNLFPSASWTRRYNLHWMLGDAIAGK